MDAVSHSLSGMRWQPAIRMLPPYYAHPVYINAIAATICQHAESSEPEPDVILLSYHGLPKDSLDKGDPYYCHCSATTRRLREKLNMSESKLRMSFQSRFGPKEWLQPYTDQTLKEMAANGIKNVMVISPGFAADCLETIEEMGIENRDVFLQAGGEKYTMIPCLNDSATGITMLNELVAQELQGWL
jgi:ferrochelatase